MVCEKCTAKLSTVVTPSPWKHNNGDTAEQRRIKQNKPVSRGRYDPIRKELPPCRICGQKVNQVGSHYCQSCAYKKAICAMCGKKILDTKNYKQSST